MPTRFIHPIQPPVSFLRRPSMHSAKGQIHGGPTPCHKSTRPRSLPHHTAANTSANPHTPALDPQQPDNPGLDDQSLQHLLSILHYAALQSEGASASTQEDGTIGRNNVVVSATGTYKRQSPLNGTSASASKGADYHDQYVLDQATLDSLYRALQAAFRHLSQKQVLGALQRTASIRWRAEAQLRNATAAQAAETTASSSRWTRFAWPAAALGKAYKEAQRSILPLFPVSRLSSASNLRPRFTWRRTPTRVCTWTRITAYARETSPLGSSAMPFGSSATMDPQPASKRLTPPLRQRPRSTKRRRHLTRHPRVPLVSSCRHPSPPSDAPRKTCSRRMLASQPSSPNPQPPPLSADGDSGKRQIRCSRQSRRSCDLSVYGSYAESLSIASSVSSPQLPVVPPSESAPDTASTALPPPETGATATPDPSTKNNNAGGEKSKAVEHLASLSAAVGAAMRQRAQQATAAAAAHGGAPEDWIDAPPTTTGARRPSLHTFVSRSEAEAAETDALEKAEKDYLAEIGQGCNEWAKMVVCRLCASISVKGDDASGTIRHRRSGTVTARDAAKARTEGADTSVGSSLSTRSDMTAKAAKVSSRSSDDLSPAMIPTRL